MYIFAAALGSTEKYYYGRRGYPVDPQQDLYWYSSKIVKQAMRCFGGSPASPRRSSPSMPPKRPHIASVRLLSFSQNLQLKLLKRLQHLLFNAL
jgi:hypothetical protein